MKSAKINIPDGGINTEKGIVYPMPALGKQILVLVASFFAAILLGFFISSTVD